MKCEGATEEDRSIAIEHTKITRKRRHNRVAGKRQAERQQSTIAIDSATVSSESTDDKFYDAWLEQHQVLPNEVELSEIASDNGLKFDGENYD